MEEIIKYLNIIIKLCGHNVVGFTGMKEQYLLKYGKEYRPSLASKNFNRSRYIEKQCFRNASILAMESKRYTYCEGYANVIIPTLHAWVIDRNGKVIDPTWKYDENASYFGVPFRTEFLRDQLLENKYYGLLSYL